MEGITGPCVQEPQGNHKAVERKQEQSISLARWAWRRWSSGSVGSVEMHVAPCRKIEFFSWLQSIVQSRIIALRRQGSTEMVSVHSKIWAVTTYGHCLNFPLASAHPANDLTLSYCQTVVPMADSFADLWSTAAPTSSAPQKPRKLNDLISSTTPSQPQRPQNDVFALLAASNSSSSSNSRTNSPGITNQPRPQSNGPKRTPPPNGDAFSGLLSGPFGNGPASSGNLSMAEQAAKAEKERKGRLLNLNQQAATKAQSSAWSGLDSLGITSTFTPPPKQATLQKQDDFDWVFDSPTSTSSKPASPPPLTKKPSAIADEDDDWGLSDFGSKPTSAPSTSAPQQKAAKPSSIWDFDDTDPSNQPSPPPRKATRPNSPGEDFDFGSREDVLLDNDSNDEDGILGSLSKPVGSLPPERPPVSS